MSTSLDFKAMKELIQDVHGPGYKCKITDEIAHVFRVASKILCG